MPPRFQCPSDEEEKQKLFHQKVKELQELFKKESLDKLKQKLWKNTYVLHRKLIQCVVEEYYLDPCNSEVLKTLKHL